MRSRSIDLTARVVAILGVPCVERAFVDGVPETCGRTYSDVVLRMQNALAARGVTLELTQTRSLGAASSEAGVEAEADEDEDASDADSVSQGADVCMRHVVALVAK